MKCPTALAPLMLGLLTPAILAADDGEAAALDAIKSMGGTIIQNPIVKTFHVTFENRPGVDDDFLAKHIQGRKNLEGLVLRGTPKVTNAGLTKLTNLPALKSVGLGSLPEVSDDGLAFLEQAKQLEFLALGPMTGITDKTMERVARMARLKALQMQTLPDVTDAGLARLGGLAELKNLTINGFPKVTDQGMKTLGKLRTLEMLQLGALSLTDQGLEFLSQLKELKSLGIFQAPLKNATTTGACLQHLTGCSKLMFLNLINVPLREKDLVPLPALPALTYLALFQTDIPDAALAPIKDFPALTTLSIAGGKITDQGIPHLVAAKKLQFVVLNNTFVSAAGIQALQKVAPKLKVQYMPRPAGMK